MMCEKCGHELVVGDFPFCKGNAADHGRGTNCRIGDEIDIEIRHGVCWPDGTPRRFRSRAELKKVEKESGYTNVVRHIDGSKHTSRWV